MAKDYGTEESPISADLLDILACPACDQRPAVTLTEDKKSLKCSECGRKYPIREGIPVMLIDEAETD